MNKKELAKRYMLFFIGLCFLSLGISLATKSTLGTSPASVVPYCLSLIFTKFSLGNWIIIFNVIVILTQWIILGKRAKKQELLLEFVLTCCFGYVTDFFVWCLGWFEPQIYIVKLLALVASCFIIAFGIFLHTIADVIMLPFDAFARAIVMVRGGEFGKVRVIADVTITILSAAMCLIALHSLGGVREGTVISAFLTGNIVRLYSRKFTKLADFLHSKIKA